MGYTRSRPFAKLVAGMELHLSIHARDVDSPGLNLIAARNTEKASSKLYIRSYDSKVSGHGKDQIYTIDMQVVGDRAELEKFEKVVNRGGLFALDEESAEDKVIKVLMNRAQHMGQVELAKQYRLAVTIRTPDEPQIVKAVSFTILRSVGTWHTLHGETNNSSTKFPGTPEFYLTGIAGFPTKADADAAAWAIKKLPYDDIQVVKLYGEGGLRFPMSLPLAA
jgi:hypothetical protein